MSRSISCVYVQKQGDEVTDEVFFRARDGFRKRRFEIELFSPREVYDGSLPLSGSTLVVGGVPVVEAALRQIGVAVPPAENLPECLVAYRGRRVWATTWGALRAAFGTAEPPGPVFVKPLHQSKAFPAFQLINDIGLLATTKFPDQMGVLASELVELTSEWRCFVLRNQIVGLSHYKGDVLTYPDPDVLRAAVRDFTPEAPAAYGIDFGVADGRTVLVEVNDAYSLGCYGLPAVTYSEMLEARWLELTATAPSGSGG